MRLNVFIAKTGHASRRKADTLVKEGKVTVNGKRVFEPFLQVEECDEVLVNRKKIYLKKEIYVLLNKPKGVTTTVYDRFAESKITDFLPKGLCLKTKTGDIDMHSQGNKRGVYPVGRLDKDSCGLIILTNDGDLCYKATHPKFLVEKEYFLKVRGVIKSNDCKKAIVGVIDEGEHLKINNIKILSREKNSTTCMVVVNEGRNKHLRRLFVKLGFLINEIKRMRIGSVVLGSLRPGESKLVSKSKIYKALFGSLAKEYLEKR